MHGTLINPGTASAELAEPDRPPYRDGELGGWRNAAAVLYAVSPGIVFFAAVVIHALASG